MNLVTIILKLNLQDIFSVYNKLTTLILKSSNGKIT
jgi:hypothetical protein